MKVRHPRLRVAVAALGAVWALAWLLTLVSLDRDIVIAPFYVQGAADAESLPVVTGLPAWTHAAEQPQPALQPGDAVVAIGGESMRGAGSLRAVSHAWVAMRDDGTLALEVERGGTLQAVGVAIPATIPKWPVLVVSGVYGVFALVCALRFGHLTIAAFGAFSLMIYALWLGAHFGHTPGEMLTSFWLRGAAVSLGWPASLLFFRHFPEGSDSGVRWARGWPWGFAAMGVFFLDAEMFGFLPAALSRLGPKLLTLAGMALVLAIGTLNYRRANAAGRRRFKWLVIGFYAALLPPALVVVVSAFRPALGAWFLPSQLAQLAIPLAAIAGWWRGDRFDVDRLWNATAVYLGGAALVVLGLVLGVPVWSEWLVARGGLAPETARVLCAAGLVALALPVAVVVRRRLDAWVLAERRAREARAAALQRELAAAGKLEEVAALLAERLPALVGASSATVHADLGEDGFGVVAREPAGDPPPAAPASGPLLRALALADAPVFASELPAPDEGWTPEERALLADGDAVFVPIRLPGSRSAADPLAAFVALGPRADGAPHDPGLRSPLAAVAASAGAVLTAREQDALLREARALNQDLVRQREASEQVSRQKTSLLAAASHDLRQPLHALGLFLGALEERVVDDEARSLLVNARDSARSMQQMFEALLDVSQIDAGVLEPRIRDDVALGPLFAEVARDLGGAAERRGLALRVHDTKLRVRSDPTLLRSILQNLVGNALRFTEQGGVLLGARRRGERVHIQVWDTGPGIAPAQRERLFGEWRRGDDAPVDTSGDAAERGFGLGLTIVRRLAALLGHDLDLASRPGRGSVFSLSLERGRAQAARRGAEARPPAPGSFAGRCVLVVDDDREARAGLATLLTGWGAEVREAADATTAAALAQADPLDAMLVDLELGGASGLDVVESLPDVPACIVSGAGPEALARARERGLLVLRKPVAPVRLRAALEHLLSVHRLSD